MTDRTDEVLDEQDDRQEAVRRLLAEARHDGALPDDVAARLDRVLEQLASGEARGLTTMGELAARRRRRARGMLAAAAAVAVVGVGLGQVLPGGLGQGSDTVSAGSAGAGEAEADGEQGDARASRPATEYAASPEAAESADDSAAGASSMLDESLQSGLAADDGVLLLAGGRPVRVRREQFAGDALKARDRLDAGRRGASVDRDFGCDPAGWGPGTGVAVLYDGRPHVLAFREPAGDTQVVDLLRCGTAEILRSTTLPAG